MKRLSAPFLLQVSEFVGRHLGLHFPPDRGSDLQRGITAAARDLGFADSDGCAQWLLSRPLTKELRDVLARHLTVGETYFFRDKHAFEAVEQHVLPELIRARRGREPHLRLWSAACCSGEEAYSLAICVRRALPDLADWRVTIIGTDINPQFLQKAARGVFGEWSFRDTPPEFRNNYFTKTADGHWQIVPEIRRMVKFFPLNLAADAFPCIEQNIQAMDLIFCRNALIYFASERALNVVHQLGQCLTSSGWLVLGPNEVSHASLPALAPVTFQGAILHRKSGVALRPTSFAPAVHEFRDSTPAMGSGGVFEHPAPPPFTWWVPTEAIESQPTEAEAAAPPRSAFAEAKSLYDQSRYAEAAAALAELASAETVDPEILILLARALANLGKRTAALTACDRVLVGHKTNHAAHYLRAGILQELGELSQAGLALKRALYLDPEFVLAHFALGNLARTQGKFIEADRHFENAFMLAQARGPDATLPEAEGLTAGRLAAMISALRRGQAVA